ncbi:MAG: alpha-amylase family glycosyl hydrolase [Aestuariibacter sp.]
MRQNDSLLFLLFCIFGLLMSDGVADTSSSDHAKATQLETEQATLNLHVASPDWRDQVIYFLMIDRFNDGDSSNNDQGLGEYNPNHESHYSGGDIPGIIEQLDYIQTLGATSVWLTPPVANQWWSRDSEYSGYHGYWARHFKKVDEHYGTLSDYQALSSALHDRGMYLIQDIVLNHTGIFFGYDGQYYPEQTDKNFVLYEEGIQSAPEMPPFDMINRRNPTHADANIYNWTPGADSYSNEEQQYTYQLGNLSDINTKNPEVLAAFKDAYRFWIEAAGVDAFRIDTVKYVEHEFWHQFLHDEDGIYAHAKQLGKSHFLTFGEVFEASPAFSDAGEQVVTSFLGTTEVPELNSVIGFPLYFEINRVFGEGQSTAQLAYRLQQFMEHYPDPYVTPNFIDNHDTKRFLSAASESAMKQALALIFTIPGIPIIYQGTEQALSETRQAMFAGGFANPESQFNTASEMFSFVKQLSALRTSNKILTRGTLEILAANSAGPGVLAYKRELAGENVIILMNSADHQILLNNIATGLPAGVGFSPLFASHTVDLPKTQADGKLTMVLPARTVLVLSPEKADKQESIANPPEITFTSDIAGKTFNQDLLLAGQTSTPNMALLLVVNGNIDNARPLASDASGNWQAIFPVRDLGTTKYTLELYAPDWQVTSEQQQFTGTVQKPTLRASVVDAKSDARGLNGSYTTPKQSASKGQMEIESITAQSAGANLEITFQMAEVTDGWAPANSFDNVSFSVFFDFPTQQGAKPLPLLQARMPQGRDWDLAHIAYGWGNYMYRSSGATAKNTGEMVGVAPQISVDKDARTVTFYYQGAPLGVTNWQDVAIYATTWDIAGEGYYRDIESEGGEWTFGGAEAGAPKVLDDVFLKLTGDSR